ncbi:hypothetical protein BCR41DRAFT_344788 [Lobosporangium transversale]|uniref:Uncharacterized protein n=1 Tax=Lobosporangium transversale TaxID=64571 RepID=A0A1Y2H0W1_9FUNG|nr:hypothetical protein BCR41DRAFT_344788 [Lobosporangium transversale]ORZ28190.1 hypothetical protein BCR41DRAFT_344788 [Lobosporangium transversale]|eukprot:XP_021885875.1 hypothetical protein BCR41DRAFT_344788 [Lobosporangium transversale]
MSNIKRDPLFCLLYCDWPIKRNERSQRNLFSKIIVLSSACLIYSNIMVDPKSVSQYYRKKLEQHELTPEEWSAVRYAVIKHTLITAGTTLTLGISAFYYARSRSWSRTRSLAMATTGNIVGLVAGGAIAMESGMKTVESRLEGSGSELLYLMDRYSKATLRERLGDRTTDGLGSYDDNTGDQKLSSPKMIGIQQDSE